MNPDFISPQKTNSQIIALEAIQIAAPCHADWNKMRGDDQVRHCQSCAKNVYNLSAMTRGAAQRLILEKEGNLCVQLRRRADGTILTSDCEVGVSIQKTSKRVVPRFFAAIAAAIVTVLGIGNGWAAPKCDTPQNSSIATTGAPMLLGKMVIVRGEMAPIVTPPVVKSAARPIVKSVAKPIAGAPGKNGKIAGRKAVKMALKNHGNNSARTARRASKPLQHRRHR